MSDDNDRDDEEIEKYGDIIECPPPLQAKYWIRELEESEKYFKDWLNRAENIEKRYRDARENATMGIDERLNATVQGINILYSNTETMKGAVYAEPPKPVVEQRFPGDDVVTRTATEVLQRCLETTVAEGQLHDVIKCGVHDYLLPGRATARVYLESDMDGELSEESENETGESSDDNMVEQETGEGMAGEGGEMQPALPTIIDQRATFKFVNLHDYRESADRDQNATRWRGYRSRLSRKAFKKRFPKIDCDRVAFNANALTKEEGGGVGDRDLAAIEQTWQRAEVWEIWDKPHRLVWWVCPGYKDGVLDVQEDILGLEEFFPGPRPAIAVHSNETKVPIPLFWLYQDQAAEIDRLTKRIYAIVDGIRANGIYAGEHAESFKRLFEADGELIGANDFAAIMDKGGIGKLIEWMPNADLAATVQSLYQAREQAKQELFEVSGMADIIRGSSDPRETLGAQKIKGQFATIRLEQHQENISNFALGLVQVAGEIIAEHFTPEILQRMSGVKLMQDEQERQIALLRLQLAAETGKIDPQMAQMQAEEIMNAVTWEQVIGVLRSDDIRRYSIRIETDSTIKMDQEQERAERIEIVKTVTELIGTLGQSVMAGAMPFDLFKKMLSFTIRGFPNSREVETLIDEWKDPPKPPPQQGQDNKQDRMEEAILREKGQTARKAIELDAQAKENDKQREFEAMQAEADRKLKAADQILSTADKIRQAQQQRATSQASMRSGNGA